MDKTAIGQHVALIPSVFTYNDIQNSSICISINTLVIVTKNEKRKLCANKGYISQLFCNLVVMYNAMEVGFMKVISKFKISLSVIISFLLISVAPGLSFDSQAAEGIPAYSGTAYYVFNNNIPGFSPTDLTRTDPFETYSELDALGRCGVAYANVCKELMPTTERGEIGMVKPSGWQTVKYNDIIDGNYLYNRCHLIGYQLAGENANVKNLITGTRYLNVDGMLPFENAVASYVERTNNHVLYRVSPIFEGNNLVASYVHIEAWSVEDNGAGISYNVFCYNVQPGIVIDYSNGNSAVLGETAATAPAPTQDTQQSQTTQQVSASPSSDGGSGTVYLSATGSCYHSIDHCGRMNPAKARATTEDNAISQGYSKCSKCW